MAALSFLGRYRDTGLLLIRIGLGSVFLVMYGYPKLAAGPEMWEGVGGAMIHMGIDFYPVVWGLLAALTEALGGLLLILGLFFRPASFFLAFIMLLATWNHLANGDGLSASTHSFEMMVVFVGLMLIGPGKYSIDKR